MRLPDRTNHAAPVLLALKSLTAHCAARLHGVDIHRGCDEAVL
jgi:hypothetical protein